MESTKSTEESGLFRREVPIEVDDDGLLYFRASDIHRALRREDRFEDWLEDRLRGLGRSFNWKKGTDYDFLCDDGSNTYQRGCEAAHRSTEGTVWVRPHVGSQLANSEESDVGLALARRCTSVQRRFEELCRHPDAEDLTDQEIVDYLEQPFDEDREVTADSLLQLSVVPMSGRSSGVSVRYLHTVLSIREEFDRWITSCIRRWELLEHLDYEWYRSTTVTGEIGTYRSATTQTDYILSLETAVGITYAEYSDRAREVRWAIQDAMNKCDRQATADDDPVTGSMSDEHRALSAENSRLRKLIVERDRTLVEYRRKAIAYDDLTDIDALWDFNTTANLLKIGRNTLLDVLRERGWLQQMSSLPMGWARDRGYFVTKWQAVSPGEGSELDRPKTYVTPRGVLAIRQMLVNKGYVTNATDQERMRRKLQRLQRMLEESELDFPEEVYSVLFPADSPS